MGKPYSHKPIKARRSKRTLAVAIPKSVKVAVAIRDGGRCIVCGGVGIPNAHIIPRSAGGLGVEDNIVCLCPKCHHEFDNGMNREYYADIVYSYIKSKVPNWNRENYIYRKWGD